MRKTLVLSLMITNASNSFRQRNDAIVSLAINIVKLDHVLQHYGAQVHDLRATLKDYAGDKIEDVGRDLLLEIEVPEPRKSRHRPDQEKKPRRPLLPRGFVHGSSGRTPGYRPA